MNGAQKTRLQVLASSLSRVDKNNNPVGLPATYKAIRRIIADIYKAEADVQTVLFVEQTVNGGYANMTGNTLRTDRQMEKLATRAKVGLEVYEVFRENPKRYVAYIETANRDMGKFPGEGRRFADGIPIDPVGAAFTQLRKQLAADMDHISPQADRKPTFRMRFDATIKAERLYLEKFLAGRDDEPEARKQERLQDFDRRMEKLARGLGSA